MAVLPFRVPTDVDLLLRVAIRARRLVRFTLHGLHRVAEPHDYGVVNGVTRLFFYQVGGESSSGEPVGWRWAALTDIEGLTVLDEQFAGPRDAVGAGHANWDRLFASVSSRDTA